MVDTLILWAIESTILTSAGSVIQIILFLTRTDLIWAGVFLVQSKLFSNAMLASGFVNAPPLMCRILIFVCRIREAKQIRWPSPLGVCGASAH
ncbi:hypothetical protein B0H14DRAFT_564972 [Mycena olivaceomarginata]|nr:hypothetical protein B0H14DRAFT_564972 [Mycena olivaceomarginata]